VVVIGSNTFNEISLRIIIPLTTWQEKFSARPLMVKTPQSAGNGLDRDSAANVLQVRTISTLRFIRKMGDLEADILKEILAGLLIAIDYYE
jgi:mRNA interferase MazF